MRNLTLSRWPPDYAKITAERIERNTLINQMGLQELEVLKAHYRRAPWEFIEHFGTTLDSRSIAKGKPALVPFVLWPAQRKLIQWIHERWQGSEPGTIVKSRDVGASWCVMAYIGTMMVLHANFAAGVASATEVKLDRANDPDTLLYKLREFLRSLPDALRGGFDEAKHSSYMRVWIPETGGSCTGEAGDAAGRGSRKSFYAVDESAHFPRPRAIDAALAATTDCRIDLSSVCGTANSFYERAHNPNIPRTDIRWTDDPRKSPEWYEELCRTTDPLTVRQEYDCDWVASTPGQLIKPEHVYSAFGAREKLGLEAAGSKRAALDVSDQGRDFNALAIRHGIELVHLEQWTGKASNIYASTVKAFGICDEWGVRALDFDQDGLGAGVAGDADNINGQRRAGGRPELEVVAFRGSGAVFAPEESLITGSRNKDRYVNMKAQVYEALARRLELTHRVVQAKERGEPAPPYVADDLISFGADLPEKNRLIAELTQIATQYTPAGRLQINKQPDGAASPNLADAVAMCFSPFQIGAYFSSSLGAAPANPATHQMPTHLDHVFAVVIFVGDAVAVVYVGAHNLETHAAGRSGCGCWILDWDLRELGAGADALIGEIAARAEELQRAVLPLTFRAAPVLVDDFDEGWAQMLRQRGFPAIPVGKDLPPIGERFAKAQPYVRIGGLVKHAEPAERRMVSFHGSTRNHLRELSNSTEVTESNPLALAYATAILTVYGERDVVPHPLERVAEAAAVAAGPWRGYRV